MTDYELVSRAAAPLVDVIRNVKPDHLDAPTPCTDYDVRRLLNHLLFWGASLEGAARKEAVPPPAAAETEIDLVHDDWLAELEGRLDGIVGAWSQPAAWVGTTRMGGPMELPAPMVGGMVLGELVVHGWDVARSTGQVPSFDEELIVYVLDEVAQTAALGRHLGIYGPEVAVPQSAPTLDRVLGMTGRDPGWSA